MFSYPEDVSVEDQVIYKMQIELLRQCVSELSEEDQLLLHTLYYQKKTLDDRAEEFGSCEKTIRNMHEHVLSKLRKEINIL